MKKLLLLALIAISIGLQITAQSIGINTETPDASAILDVKSTNKGMLVPRLTKFQRLTIPNPAEGLLVFDIESDAFWYFQDGWKLISDNSKKVWLREHSTFPAQAGDTSMYFMGNIAIGKDSADAALDIIQDGKTGIKLVQTYNTNDEFNQSERGIGLDIETKGGRNYYEVGAHIKLNGSSLIKRGVEVTLTPDDSTTVSQYGFLAGLNGVTTGQNSGFLSSMNTAGAGAHYGVQTIMRKNGEGQSVGIINYMDGEGPLYEVGTWNEFYVFSDNTGLMTGTINNFRPSSDTTQIGTFNNFESNGSGERVGVRNKLKGFGHGDQYAIKTIIENGGDGTHYGVYSEIENDGDGTHYGEYTSLSGSGSGTHYGSNIVLSGTGIGPQYGHIVDISNTGSAAHYGQQSTLSGSGNGKQYGQSNIISNTGTNSHYGTYNQLIGSASGGQFGTYQTMTITGSGNQFGNYNAINGSGSGNMYATYNNVFSSGDGTHYGTYNRITDIGAGTHIAGYFEAFGTGPNKYAAIFNTGQVVANEIGGDNDFRIESEDNENMLLVDASTNRIGIGTDTPGSSLHVNHGNVGSSGTGLRLTNEANGEMARFYVASTSGNLRIYTDNQSGAIGEFDDVSGVYTPSSDARLKENIESLPFNWSSFMQLRPLLYEFKADDSNQKHIGMVAQEVQKIYPQMVRYSEDEDKFHMDYGAFGVIAIRAIQQQQKMIDQLKSENEQLKQEVNSQAKEFQKELAEIKKVLGL